MDGASKKYRGQRIEYSNSSKEIWTIYSLANARNVLQATLITTHNCTYLKSIALWTGHMSQILLVSYKDQFGSFLEIFFLTEIKEK